MNLDDRARLRLYARNAVTMWERTGTASGMAVEVCESVPALLDHIDQAEAQLAEARATKNMHKDRYEDLLATVERIRALHEHRAPEAPYVEYCEHCGADWPCETVRVLDGDGRG